MADLKEVQECIKKIFEQRLQMQMIAKEDGEALSGKSLQLDSMAMLELVVGIEEEFGIAINDEELSTPQHFRNLESIALFVFRHL